MDMLSASLARKWPEAWGAQLFTGWPYEPHKSTLLIPVGCGDDTPSKQATNTEPYLISCAA